MRTFKGLLKGDMFQYILQLTIMFIFIVVMIGLAVFSGNSSTTMESIFTGDFRTFIIFGSIMVFVAIIIGGR